MPGPTFTRPPTVDTGEQARRQDFERLFLHRQHALAQRTNPPTSSDDLALLGAIVAGFVDTVEQANSSRALLRQQQIEYVDAVVVDGSGGQLVVDAVDYDSAPVYWQSRAGEVTSVVHGNDLDAYLRTGERRYAEAIGLR
jgi:hypothetical protein